MIENVFPGIGGVLGILCVCGCHCYPGDPTVSDETEDWNREGVNPFPYPN